MSKIVKGDHVIVISGRDKVAIYNKETQKADRVGIKLIDDNGKVRRVRVFKSNGAELA